MDVSRQVFVFRTKSRRNRTLSSGHSWKGKEWSQKHHGYQCHAHRVRCGVAIWLVAPAYCPRDRRTALHVRPTGRIGAVVYDQGQRTRVTAGRPVPGDCMPGGKRGREYDVIMTQPETASEGGRSTRIKAALHKRG
jgi:hypothetical protein